MLNTAGSVANLGIEAIVESIKTAVDEGKDTLRAPVLELKNSADDIAAFMQIVVEQATEQIEFARNKITSVASKLEQCKSFEDVINLIMQQIFEMLGMDSDFEIDDIRDGWKEVGTMIDDAIVWAEGLRSSAGGGGAPPPAPQTPVFAGGAAAEPPPGGGAGGGDEPPDGADGQGAAAAQAAGQARERRRHRLPRAAEGARGRGRGPGARCAPAAAGAPAGALRRGRAGAPARAGRRTAAPAVGRRWSGSQAPGARRCCVDRRPGTAGIEGRARPKTSHPGAASAGRATFYVYRTQNVARAPGSRRSATFCTASARTLPVNARR